jgi:hypothetical protein
MSACDAGSVAIGRVSGYHFPPGGGTALVNCLKAATGGEVFVQNSATITDDHGVAAAPEAVAVRATARARMTRLGRARFGAAAVFRKGLT